MVLLAKEDIIKRIGPSKGGNWKQNNFFIDKI